MDFERLLSLLHSRSLYLSRVDNLADPWEGHWPTPVVDHFYEKWLLNGPGARSKFVEALHDIRARNYVNCWHENSGESAALWEIYGDSRGLALQSSVARLKTAASGEQQWFLGRVRYLDFDKPIDRDWKLDSCEPLFLKRISFEHEREVRVLANQWRQYDIGHTKVGPPQSLNLPVNLADMIESIHISPRSPEWFVDPVRDLLRRFDLQGVRVVRSSLYDKAIQ